MVPRKCPNDLARPPRRRRLCPIDALTSSLASSSLRFYMMTSFCLGPGPPDRQRRHRAAAPSRRRGSGGATQECRTAANQVFDEMAAPARGVVASGVWRNRVMEVPSVGRWQACSGLVKRKLILGLVHRVSQALLDYWTGLEAW